MEYKSDILKSIHQDAIADYEVGAISESRMLEYDKMCLVKSPEPVYTINKSLNIKKMNLPLHLESV